MVYVKLIKQFIEHYRYQCYFSLLQQKKKDKKKKSKKVCFWLKVPLVMFNTLGMETSCLFRVQLCLLPFWFLFAFPFCLKHMLCRYKLERMYFYKTESYLKLTYLVLLLEKTFSWNKVLWKAAKFANVSVAELDHCVNEKYVHLRPYRLE